MRRPLTRTAGTSRDDARKLLLEQLVDGPVLNTDLKKAAKEVEIPFWRMDRAADELSIEKKKIGFGKGAPWEWNLLPLETRREWLTKFPEMSFPGARLVPMKHQPRGGSRQNPDPSPYIPAGV